VQILSIIFDSHKLFGENAKLIAEMCTWVNNVPLWYQFALINHSPTNQLTNKYRRDQNSSAGKDLKPAPSTSQAKNLFSEDQT